jgi:hypothetical protein
VPRAEETATEDGLAIFEGPAAVPLGAFVDETEPSTAWKKKHQHFTYLYAEEEKGKKMRS